MYNEEVKKRYIVEKESTTLTPKDFLSRYFEKVQEFEMRFNKDVSCFTMYEIVDFYKTLNTASINSLTVLNSHFSLYTDWCLKQNMVPDCQNHFSEITHDILLTCINTMAMKKSIVTRETLYAWLGELLNASDAFIMLALFEGIRGVEFCEIANLKMSDFSGNKVRLCTGRELTVSNKLVEIAKDSNDTLTYYPIVDESERKLKFRDEDLIVKNFCNVKDTNDTYVIGRRIYRRLMRNFAYLGIEDWMKASSLIESGKIDFINRRSQELGMTGKEIGRAHV